jgi:hypothetical protein
MTLRPRHRRAGDASGGVFADPQILARGMVAEVEARAGKQKTLGVPLKTRRQAARRAAPVLSRRRDQECQGQGSKDGQGLCGARAEPAFVSAGGWRRTVCLATPPRCIGSAGHAGMTCANVGTWRRDHHAPALPAADGVPSIAP